MSLATRSDVGCCVSCGRDTRYGQPFCRRCLVGPPKRLGPRALAVRPPELEDDYSEESDANSICNDQTKGV